MSTDTPFVSDIERQRARTDLNADFYAKALEASKEFRREYKERKNVVKHNEMPMERSADGLIKHIINEGMNTKECALDIYMQFLPANGSTGTSRHLSEEVAFVIEGTGYDLHYDVRFKCEDEFVWEWETEPKKYEWGPGDFIYIPPYCAHKRFNTDANTEARVVVINSRMMKAIGFDWFDQLEPAKGFEDLWVPPTE
ncbi:cupin domain-containing protein [Pseudomonas agarici]|uniref:cupin domain-containing protein n=1 Tax=Pseudomonas agarici TaxID=46677 RepID=UPI0002E805A1|nr:cupin domain-containing protein [Pseudomonas agarici]NWB91415.1 cupin domain-containing protein [Pseudomonas agarici]NWC07837.1 cupin domain-containing protein [Pseudomonas agarici]SEK75741.1 Auxin binding protein [Pseudomonas agarici]